MPRHNCQLNGLAVSKLLWQHKRGVQSTLSTTSHPRDCLGKNRVFCMSSCFTVACSSAQSLKLPRVDGSASLVEMLGMHANPCCCKRMLEQHRVPNAGLTFFADETWFAAGLCFSLCRSIVVILQQCTGFCLVFGTQRLPLKTF